MARRILLVALVQGVVAALPASASATVGFRKIVFATSNSPAGPAPSIGQVMLIRPTADGSSWRTL